MTIRAEVEETLGALLITMQEGLVAGEVEEVEEVVAETQLHGALPVLMVEVAVENLSGASAVEAPIMLMRAQIGNNDDCITLVEKFHLVGKTTQRFYCFHASYDIVIVTWMT
jgi:hypothetical protein